MKKTLIALFATLPLLAQAKTEQPTLSLQDARLIADAAELSALNHQESGQAKPYQIVISIVDSHGNLKYFRRLDNTASGSIQVSQLKAATSAAFPVATHTLAERSAGLPGNPYASTPGFLLLEGGVPIFDQHNRHVGGIGISGATPALDRAFAEAGLMAYAKSQNP